MTTDALPDASTSFGRRVRDRLRDEVVVWLTTVGADGTPRPNPVWFVWTGDDVLLYSHHAARRLAAIRERPRVSLHFNSDATGEDVIVMAGDAEIDEALPSADASPEYLAKYGESMARVSGSTEQFAQTYSAPVRVRISRVRGY